MIDRQQIIDKIKTVFDPEIPVNVYDLGLIYNVDIQDESKVNIKMTLTTQGCPSAQQIPHMIRAAASMVPGVTDVTVDVVWEPAWTPNLISPEGKKILHLDDAA